MTHKQIDHLHFYATDLKASRKFYEDIGFEFIREISHGDKPCIQMKSPGGLVIDVNETANVNNPGFSHYAVEVDNIEEMAKELSAKGYWIDGPTTNKDTKRFLLTVRDSNGFLVQFVEYKK